MTISITVNGEVRNFDGDPRTALIDVLREHLRLTGSKPVCREGFCGACNVYVDGEAMTSCLLPVGALEGKSVVTIEGISTGQRLNKVQQAFVDHDVVQCGMCFPGMVMTISAYLAENPTPTRTELKSAIEGNLCRCTGYERIIDAVMSLQADGVAS